MSDINQPSTAQLLELVNVQMASEAFLIDKNQPMNSELNRLFTDEELKNSLIGGNEHSTKFTSVTATQFVENWKVVAHQANTTTGFSGTLFQAKQDIEGTTIKQGDQVISFRSTEFIEDTLHDNRATNTFEIKEKGWAFGQISDMQTWFQQLKDSGSVHGGLTVTGYSLGGHLATAFSLLHPGMIDNTYTFNGAGAGFIIATDKDGNPILDTNGKPVHTTSLADTGEQLGKIIEQFNKYRTGNLSDNPPDALDPADEYTDSIFTTKFNIKQENQETVEISTDKIYKEIRNLLNLKNDVKVSDNAQTADDIKLFQQHIEEALQELQSNMG